MLGVAQLINEAWSYESNNDQEVALRLYRTAFNNILDINGQVNTTTTGIATGVSPFEIRSVADYINHRTCHIQFNSNHPREAITQFKKYIDVFKQHTKSPDYAFEHASWLSQQYLMFADLFHQAVTAGVKASRTQHPGYYYYEAAMQMIDKRRHITEYTNDEIRSNQMPVTNELLSMITTNNFTSFLRQCGWICIDPNAGPPVAPISLTRPDRTNKLEPINHSENIIKALLKAVEHFEEWNRPRIQNHIGVMIADEYLLSNDTTKALALYTKSLTLYEREGWTHLVDDIKAKSAIINAPTERTC